MATKLSQIASGGAVNPSTDVLVAVRSGSSDVLVSPGVTSFNTRTGAITLTSSDVTTALGDANIAFTDVANSFTVSPQTITCDADNHVGLKLIPHSGSQTANLLNALDSTGTITRAHITPAGEFSNQGGVSSSEVYGTGVTVSGTESVVIGAAANSSASSPTGRAVVVGYNASISNSGAGDSVVVGWGAAASGAHRFQVALGASSATSAAHAIAVGAGASCSGDSAVAIGPNASVTTTNGVSIGNNNSLSGSTSGPVLGANLTSSATYALSIGTSNTVSHVGTAAIGGGLSSSRQREFVIGVDTSNGAGAWTGGHRIRLGSTASDNALYDLALADATWKDSTAATRKGGIALGGYDSAGGPRYGVEAWADGTYGRNGIFIPPTAVTDGQLNASEMSFYLDETNGFLKGRVKYSNGTTLKTANIPLSGIAFGTFQGNFGDGTAGPFTVTHNLGVSEPMIQIWYNNGSTIYLCTIGTDAIGFTSDITVNPVDSNSFTFTWVNTTIAAPPASGFNVLVIGF